MAAFHRLGRGRRGRAARRGAHPPGAYARHLPTFAQTLGDPEPADAELGALVLLARSKLDGTPLGTLRIQTNRHRPLDLERSMNLPAHLAHARLAEATRLGLAQGEGGRLVKAALFKAFYLHCRQSGVEHMVITGRVPIDRQYQRLLFEGRLDAERNLLHGPCERAAAPRDAPAGANRRGTLAGRGPPAAAVHVRHCPPGHQAAGFNFPVTTPPVSPAAAQIH